jgi:hypothetical protein
VGIINNGWRAASRGVEKQQPASRREKMKNPHQEEVGEQHQEEVENA